MINFPVFDGLDIWNYGIFPGVEDSDPGLHVRFQPGLTLILGANGLGKTTLVTMIYRMLTGPFDIPRLGNKASLGTTKLDARQLSRKMRRLFADRVMDGAREASARLSFQLGDHNIAVERRLNTLALTRCEFDGQELQTNGEESYQRLIAELVGVPSFGDWILLLRYLVFYFEDRRALVWDSSAQRHILRILFLPVPVARRWVEDEREISELDSRMRNLNAAVGREERDLEEKELKKESKEDVLSELGQIEASQDDEFELLDDLENELVEVDDARKKARLRVLRSEQSYEAHYRGIERTKLLAIAARFPDLSETARYIIAQILADQDCIVCGSHVPEAAEVYSSRIETNQCVICASDLGGSHVPSGVSPGDFDAEIAQGLRRLELLEANLHQARIALRETEESYHVYLSQIAQIRERIDGRSLRIKRLVLQLPAEDAKMHKQKSELTSMRARVEVMRADLAAKRDLFAEFIEHISRDIAYWKEDIKSSFDNYAKGFLLEQCQLIWSPQKLAIGQTGISIEFPAFELDMSGADFPSPARRSGPDQVSESQREFIDLAFRMALMSIAAEGGSSLVMDAPESSLDAVFAPLYWFSGKWRITPSQ